jgi:hypothetical protein
MNRIHVICAQLKMAAAAVLFNALFTANAAAVPATGWTTFQGAAAIMGANSASPMFGTGEPGSIDNFGVYGSLQTPVSISAGQEAVLTGRVQILGHTGAAREFRWGMWKKIVQGVNPNALPAVGWLGYMGLNGAGGLPGRLEVKNPDSDFQNANFMSDFGGASLAFSSGPSPQLAGIDCSPLMDGACNGTSDLGRYFLLDQTVPDGNAAFGDNLWYNFEVRVRRLDSNSAAVSASLIADVDQGGTSPYIMRINDVIDMNGLPLANPVANPAGTYTPHLTFEFDRVGFLFGGALDADKATLQNIDVSIVPEPGVFTLLVTFVLVSRWPRCRVLRPGLAG